MLLPLRGNLIWATLANIHTVVGPLALFCSRKTEVILKLRVPVAVENTNAKYTARL